MCIEVHHVLTRSLAYSQLQDQISGIKKQARLNGVNKDERKMHKN